MKYNVSITPGSIVQTRSDIPQRQKKQALRTALGLDTSFALPKWPEPTKPDRIQIYDTEDDCRRLYHAMDKYRVYHGSRLYGSGFLREWYHRFWFYVVLRAEDGYTREVINPGWPCVDPDFPGFGAGFSDLSCNCDRITTQLIGEKIVQFGVDHRFVKKDGDVFEVIPPEYDMRKVERSYV